MRDNLTVIYPGVVWKGSYLLDPFVIVGKIPAKEKKGSPKTCIGTGALIRSHTVIYAGSRIGKNFNTGHGALIRENNKIGNDVSVGSHSEIAHSSRIGNRVRIHSNVFVGEFSNIGDDCWIGPNAVLTNAKYPASPRAKDNLAGPRLERGAKIGANATLLPGVRIGRNALVGAGAVVTKDVPPGAVVAGNPSRKIKDISCLPYGKER